VVLAILAERAAGQPYHELVHERVCQPAGLVDTAFLRNDESHERAAEHYLTDSGLRTNVLHLPVTGVGDGGITSTAEDLHAFWRALFAGRIVFRPGGPVHEGAYRGGRGGDVVRARVLAGAGRARGGAGGLRRGRVVPQPPRSVSGVTATVMSNTTDGAWPIVRDLQQALRQ
jgi:CubicO group peptidase (beta-lactamase class C family)